MPLIKFKRSTIFNSKVGDPGKKTVLAIYILKIDHSKVPKPSLQSTAIHAVRGVHAGREGGRGRWQCDGCIRNQSF